MKTQRWLLIIVILLVLLVVANIFISLWRTRENFVEYGNTTPNESALKVDRVKNEAERLRMKNYLDEYMKEQKVVKTIVTSSGEIIDCIDLYSQPGLRMNDLKKEDLLFAPKTWPEDTGTDTTGVQDKDRSPDLLYQLTGEKCPQGAIPVLRLTMETLPRFETLDDFFKKGHGFIQPPCGSDGSSAPHEYAHASRNIANWGAESILNVWSPYVEKSNEFSLSQIWVVRGSGADRETVEAGWQVYKDLYGDWRAHLFIYFTPDNYGKT